MAVVPRQHRARSAHAAASCARLAPPRPCRVTTVVRPLFPHCTLACVEQAQAGGCEALLETRALIETQWGCARCTSPSIGGETPSKGDNDTGAA